MLDAYNKEEAEYNNAVKNSEQLKTRVPGLQEEIEKQNKIIQQLQEIVNNNNETISSLKKIKNLSIFDLVKDDQIKDQIKIDNIKDQGSNSINLDNVLGKTKEDKTKFDSNWDPQFPDSLIYP
ncbi:hypothetical protein ACJMK2_027770 [Sinanodonta woodiana]|uniref:Uncharacterized protein n=1 Tax=Sinanodonta woodiana TaxID=1069815 RepID=A0ABD3X8J3_SINWO